MTIALILNIAFSAVVFVALIAHIVHSIRTQHHDRGVTLVSGQRRHRWEWTRADRPQRARPQGARQYRGQHQQPAA
jgi:hypothetical protein